jgi:uncharacterized membrane protein YkvA (DUF1232 family)
MSRLAEWRARARALASDLYALSLAARDPRVPWYAKALALLVTAYALSPIDLIPDFIPILGHLDDVVLVPIGIAVTVRLIPDAVWAECRERARAGGVAVSRARWVMAGVIALIWALVIVWLACPRAPSSIYIFCR